MFTTGAVVITKLHPLTLITRIGNLQAYFSSIACSSISRFQIAMIVSSQSCSQLNTSVSQGEYKKRMMLPQEPYQWGPSKETTSSRPRKTLPMMPVVTHSQPDVTTCITIAGSEGGLLEAPTKDPTTPDFNSIDAAWRAGPGCDHAPHGESEQAPPTKTHSPLQLGHKVRHPLLLHLLTYRPPQPLLLHFGPPLFPCASC